MPAKSGSTFAYELTQSIATNGANRQTAITTLRGVMVGCFPCVASGMAIPVPSLITSVMVGKSRGLLRSMEPPSA